MQAVALRILDADVEGVLDALLPLLADGVHVRPEPAGDAVRVVALARTAPLPPTEDLAAACGTALLGVEVSEEPDDPRERRRRAGAGGVLIGDEVWLRSEEDPPAPPGVMDVVLQRAGAFGTGTHPTTRMCVALLLGLDPVGGFADLGCGAGALAIIAALRGFAPVEAVDVSPRSVAAAAANADRNGAAVDAYEADLVRDPLPARPTVAANVPLAVHLALAPALVPVTGTVIASGIHVEDRAVLAGAYAAAGFTVREEGRAREWLALLLERA